MSLSGAHLRRDIFNAAQRKKSKLIEKKRLWGWENLCRLEFTYCVHRSRRHGCKWCSNHTYTSFETTGNKTFTRSGNKIHTAPTPCLVISLISSEHFYFSKWGDTKKKSCTWHNYFKPGSFYWTFNTAVVISPWQAERNGKSSPSLSTHFHE